MKPDPTEGRGHQGYMWTEDLLRLFSLTLIESERPLEAINAPLQFNAEMGKMRLRGTWLGILTPQII